MRAITKTVILSCVLIPLGYFLFCVPIARNDIYKKCPKGDTVSFALFTTSNRILKTKNNYYFTLNINEGSEYDFIAMHLLACDRNMVLKGATSANKIIITGAKEDTVLGWTMKEWKEENKTVTQFRNDLPKTSFLKVEEKNFTWNGFSREENTVIDSIQFLPQTFSARFYLRTSDSTFWPQKKEYLAHRAHYDSLFCHPKVIDIPIDSLGFSIGESYIYTYKPNYVMNQMYVVDKSTILKLYADIWADMKANRVIR